MFINYAKDLDKVRREKQLEVVGKPDLFRKNVRLILNIHTNGKRV